MTQVIDGPLADLTALLQLMPCGEDIWRSVLGDANAGGEVFGGQYLGLSIAAAMLSAPGRMPHMMSSFFLRGAQASEPVDYRVERTRDGRGFAHRRVSAWQGGKEAFRAEVSFHEWEEGQPSHSSTGPAVPPLETLRSHRQCVLDRVDELAPLVVRRVINRGAIETYFLDGDEGLGKSASQPETTAWLRPVPAPPTGHAIAYYATLAYLTDACANFAGRIMHAPQLHDGELASTSLNHAIWFHQPPQPIERLLYVVNSPFAGGGLAFNHGTLFDAQGDILASVTQEALIRRRTESVS